MASYEMTAHELSAAISNKDLKVAEVAADFFRRIEAVDPKVRAYVTLNEAEAMAQAEQLDRRLAKGEKLPPLAGIPIAVKDNISTAGLRTTCSSKMLENYIPAYDAMVIERLKAAGMIIVGKTNLDEFAMGSSTENSALFVTRNPWDLEAVPGGSSGGSAAAVRAGEAALALGSDTGGSIRQPAAYCGVVGLKPTYGRVSRYGLIAFASSLDQIGPITRDVTDCALLLQAIAQYDKRDSTCIDQPVPDYLQALKQDVKGLRIGLAQEYLGEGISAPVQQAVNDAVRVFRDLGAEVVDVSLPYTQYALATYYIIAPAEASSNLARYDGVRYGHRTAEEVSDSVALFMKTRKEGFGPEVKRRIMIGTYALSSGYYDAYYLKAQQVRTLIREDFNRAFQSCDLILTPTAPSVAFKIGSKTKDPLEMYLEDICTITCNMAGIPGLSLPGGFDQGKPIGLQLLGPAFGEATLLRAAYGFEQATDFHKRRPEL
ncbi:aspartyl/glutamyl-tRNA(Asn/Gln) amidotransferase subunit A [Hydrogenispora ethanolica]|uniref:Glutamyl-tRNA(Gln) amidotransferase subunit A n=1 Tax=Hydrogenispora ethanolica TaxID=1082276 RepID=A0A4R1RUC1_HYDET|nr:Asp-tRNA(Asn)/Glu-tRNA(Gln) amidotransferase subunit GatA [Hydrogenispora ethanolica]TCL69984.1 aspartyl/glutamyl-tRNA(Asn/Gln) amidotransferase subunit A [Hydrogenispora ethanolica]